MSELELLRLGAALGIIEEPDLQKSVAQKQKLAQYSQEQLTKARNLYYIVLRLLKQVKESEQKEQDEEDEDQSVLSDDEQAKLVAKSDLAGTHKYLDKIRNKHHQKVKSVKKHFKSASNKTKWVLYKKDRLEALNKKISSLIKRLQDSIPGLLNESIRLAGEEVKDACQMVLEELLGLAGLCKPVAEALAQRCQSSPPRGPNPLQRNDGRGSIGSGSIGIGQKCSIYSKSANSSRSGSYYTARSRNCSYAASGSSRPDLNVVCYSRSIAPSRNGGYSSNGQNSLASRSIPSLVDDGSSSEESSGSESEGSDTEDESPQSNSRVAIRRSSGYFPSRTVNGPFAEHKSTNLPVMGKAQNVPQQWSAYVQR